MFNSSTSGALDIKTNSARTTFTKMKELLVYTATG